jgi:cytochrome P450
VTSENDLSDISLFSPETLCDPWDTYRRLRDHAPVFPVPELNLKVVTRYDLLMEVIRDTETYSSNSGDFIGGDGSRFLAMAPPDVQDALKEIRSRMMPPINTLLTADPPVHGKYRSLVGRVFTAGKVRKMQPYVDAIIGDTIDQFIDEDGPIDFMEGFAFPVPIRIIADRLGVPPEDRELFYDGATATAAGLRLTVPSPEEMLRRAKLGVELQNYMVDLVERRRKDPQDDMATTLALAELADEKRPLNGPELWSIINQFLIAGHETTTSAFGAGMLLLVQHPELQEQIRGEPELVRTFVEEVLRLEAPVQGLPRRVTRDTELGGFPLKASEMIMLRYGAANRDERQFDRPDEVDLHRKNAGSHLAFGSGTHHCPGAPLSRQEMTRGFPALLERMGNFRLAPGHPEPKAEPSFILRSLPELWIDFDRRA